MRCIVNIFEANVSSYNKSCQDVSHNIFGESNDASQVCNTLKIDQFKLRI